MLGAVEERPKKLLEAHNLGKKPRGVNEEGEAGGKDKK